MLIFGLSSNSYREKEELITEENETSIPQSTQNPNNQIIQVERLFFFATYGPEKLLVADFASNYIDAMYDSSREYRKSQ